MASQAFEWLWIDALCINQSDTSERNEQVFRMGEIFRNAALVVAWIEPCYSQSDLAMELISKPMSYWKRKIKLFRVWTTSEGPRCARFWSETTGGDYGSIKS